MELNRCSKCGLALIQEEIWEHQCRSVVDYRFEDDVVWLFDGEIWYPRKLQQPKSNTEKKDREGNRIRNRKI